MDVHSVLKYQGGLVPCQRKKSRRGGLQGEETCEARVCISRPTGTSALQGALQQGKQFLCAWGFGFSWNWNPFFHSQILLHLMLVFPKYFAVFQSPYSFTGKIIMQIIFKSFFFFFNSRILFLWLTFSKSDS